MTVFAGLAAAAIILLLLMTKGSSSAATAGGSGPQPGDTTSLPVDQIKALLVDAASRYGIDSSLALAVAKQESEFNQQARSSVGAIGVMQLMPATAAGLSIDPYDVYQNIDGGVRYLAQLLGKYGGDSSLALAAYNAGPGNVDKYGGIPPFAETENYVASVLNYQQEFSA